MKVFKFGGASVRDAEAIKNLARIVISEKDDLVVVVSAFSKTTNALEGVLKSWLGGNKNYEKQLDDLHNYHNSVIKDLNGNKKDFKEKNDILFESLSEFLKAGIHCDYDTDYDQVVSYGELWSTVIIAGYLKTQVPSVSWIDIRKILITDNRHRDANVLWDESTGKVKSACNFTKNRIYVTQGFIAGTSSGLTTTLGREGSDYTAAVLANILDAEQVVVWKDVPGLLNADPKWFPDAEKLPEISYKEAVEMSFSGAKVIHPKTIKPLHNKNIPLQVRSFLDVKEKGTIVKADAELKKILPVYIRKEDQILISILPKDLSFVMGDNLARIFHSFQDNGIKVNLVEASAVSLDVCVDDERPRIESFIKENESDFSVVYNEDVELLSVRHYTPASVTKVTDGREILLEQRTRSTVRFVVRNV
ncbi:MAG TPA: aspartate kinase [Bacteroidales bacterium]|nr:aspartate kinase [Bacteroidales bacterium]